MIARITDAWAAAPMPCRKRALTRSSCDGAMPQSSDAAVKTVSPARKIRLRPSRSPSLPASSSRLPNVIRKPLTIHVRFDWLKPRSSWIAGRATFTIVTSRTIISCAKQTMASVIQRRRSADSLRIGRGREETFIWLLDLPNGLCGPKMEAASEISGGSLRNYTEAASGLST